MQKIFIRNFLMIMVITVLITVVINSLIQTTLSEYDAIEAGESMVCAISEKLDNSRRNVASAKDSFRQNYVARARALAELIAQNPDILADNSQMPHLAEILGVDEIYITDQNGVIRWGNVSAHYGFDFATTDQTRPFLPALTDKRFVLVQDPQPNGSEGKLFQYVGVARQDAPGIVQVGVTPEVLEQALAQSKIDVVVADFNVADGETVFVIDGEGGTILADSARALIGTSYQEAGIPQRFVQAEEAHGWISLDGRSTYAVFRQYDGYVIGAGFTRAQLAEQHWEQNIVAICSSTLLGLIIIVSIFIMLKREIIDDIELVNSNLNCITQGNLDVAVQAKGTPELQILSHGINEMVDSLKKQISERASQAAVLEETNRGISASLSYARRIQNNLLPDPTAFQTAFADYGLLWEPKEEVGGDIYWIKNFPGGTVLCMCDCTGHGTPGALLTMLVVTVLATTVTEQNCDDPAGLMWELDQKLISTLSSADSSLDINDGADLAILYVAHGGDITMASANTRLFICNGTDIEVIRGQKISIGEGGLSGKERIRTFTIPHTPGNQYYIASDGLFDQIGGPGNIPFGYRHFQRILLECHSLPMQEIADAVWRELKGYMGREARRDDITLVGFKP